MDISKVIAISGKPGLYKIISQSKNGFIAEGLHDGKRLPVYKSHQVSGLSDVSIYTDEGEIPLQKVFEAIYSNTNGEAALSDASTNEAYRDFMEEVLPDYDRDRVYISDIKKLVKWFNLLLAHGYFTEDEQPDSTVADSSANETPESSESAESGVKTEDQE